MWKLILIRLGSDFSSWIESGSDFDVLNSELLRFQHCRIKSGSDFDCWIRSGSNFGNVELRAAPISTVEFGAAPISTTVELGAALISTRRNRSGSYFNSWIWSISMILKLISSVKPVCIQFYTSFLGLALRFLQPKINFNFQFCSHLVL